MSLDRKTNKITVDYIRVAYFSLHYDIHSISVAIIESVNRNIHPSKKIGRQRFQ